MRLKRKTAVVFVLCIISIGQINSQSTVPATGGTATGDGGSATYSTGQLVWNMYTGSNGTSLEGVQQPYEISVVTSIENINYIDLVCTVYPNPTRGLIKLIVKSSDFRDLKYQLYALNGAVLLEQQIRDEETEIPMYDLFSSVCFLRVIRGHREVKVFKIIKL